MAYKAPKPTKAQLAEAKIRAAASGIAMNQSAKGLRNASKAIVAGAVNLIPAGRAASVVGKFATATKATKLSSGASKVKTKKFTQGEKARITNTPPKKSKAGPNSPIRGTKVEVTYKTKELTPKQQASLTTGRIAREKTKKAATYAKGAVTGAYVMNEVDKAKAKKKTK
jgi:hypothetical protein